MNNILIIDCCYLGLNLVAKKSSSIESFNSTSTRGNAEHIISDIQQLMQALQIKFTELDVISISNGPGSFSGIRMAIAIAQAFAMAHKIPLVAISTLEALATNIALTSNYQGKLKVLIDAKMSEFYSADFVICNKQLTRTTADSLVKPEQMLYANDYKYAGDGCNLIAGLAESTLDSTIDSNTLLAITNTKIADKNFCDYQSIQPVYVRTSSAWVANKKTIL